MFVHGSLFRMFVQGSLLCMFVQGSLFHMLSGPCFVCVLVLYVCVVVLVLYLSMVKRTVFKMAVFTYNTCIISTMLLIYIILVTSLDTFTYILYMCKRNCLPRNINSVGHCSDWCVYVQSIHVVETERVNTIKKCLQEFARYNNNIINKEATR